MRGRFQSDGSQLERYSRLVSVSEINSSFHRPHRRSTYERWASAVPSGFAFSVKIPKTISHEKRCADCERELKRFMDESAGLDTKRRLLLLQLPPSFAFDASRMKRFFTFCRTIGAPRIVCEPRHASWFTTNAEALLSAQGVARVAADPATDVHSPEPGGWSGLRYFRMHGTPRMYYSNYDDTALTTLAARVRSAEVETWCIFDNTALGAALGDALRLKSLLRT